MNTATAYLLGLTTGRGHILINSKTIAIEFSHANEIAEGIAHCQKCGYLATKSGDVLKCKNPICGMIVPKNVKKIYNQPEKTKASLNKEIIPFLNSKVKAKYQILGNKSMTLLIINLSQNVKLFQEIVDIFKPNTSFDRFHIPKVIFQCKKELKIEYINGLLDTSGFPSPGGWLNRDGENGHGRMRSYFQIVRNWYLPVEIDNFLRSEFDLPIHTIDWGHPNIRDGNLEDFFNSNPTSWGREHQVKFFPEYYTIFHFRISSKKALFKELIDHNLKVKFNNKEDWLPPTKITESRIKAFHPGEDDIRIPKPARKHFDAFWQVNLAMGCKFLEALRLKAKNPNTFDITGDLNSSDDPSNIEKGFDVIREDLKKMAFKKASIKKKMVKSNKLTINGRQQKEQETYAPLAEFFKKSLSVKYSEPVETFDTSSGNLSLFLRNNNEHLLEAFDYCNRFRIRPDVVGFLTKSKRLVFIESKITPLDLKALGQLVGYCLVAQPEEAILVSTVLPSMTLIKLLKARPDLIYYGSGKKIQLATLQRDTVKFISI